MAKRGILEHPKTIELAAVLDIPEPFAVGLLECLWQHVAKYFPHGDITTLKPAVLARSIRYPGDGNALWDALLSCGFLDSNGAQTWVHDWSDHADDAVHMSLARRGLRFANGAEPKLTRLSAQERAQIEARKAQGGAPEAPASAGRAHTERTKPKPEPEPKPEAIAKAPIDSERAENGGQAAADTEGTAPPQETASGPEPEREPEPEKPQPWQSEWQAFLAAYPPRNGDRGVKDGQKVFVRLVKGGTAPAEIIAGCRRYREWADANGKTRTEFVKQIPAWLRGEAWREDWSARPPLVARGSPGRTFTGPDTRTETPDQKRERLRAALHEHRHVDLFGGHGARVVEVARDG
jgi:hypothetical protein